MYASLGTAELNRQVDLGYHPTKVFRFPYGASDATSQVGDTAIVGISPDTPARQAKFDDKYSLGFPLLSDEDHAVAEAYGVGIGDRLGFNILGRVVEAEIASLRAEIDWGQARLDFVFLFSPGVLEAAPHTLAAAVGRAIAAREEKATIGTTGAARARFLSTLSAGMGLELLRASEVSRSAYAT